jgi:hypothetical protein
VRRRPPLFCAWHGIVTIPPAADGRKTRHIANHFKNFVSNGCRLRKFYIFAGRFAKQF